MRHILALLLLTSCGYRFGSGGALQDYCTISVPFVCGDERGLLTDALIQDISTAGWTYSATDGELQLCVSLCGSDHENIGYQYDRKNDGERSRRIVPNEGRLYLRADVSVLDDCGNTLLGPTCISAYVDYDFNPLQTNTELTVFSVGQFVNIDEARQAARAPLYDRLAHKIVDYLALAW